jgi:hypothetical protein
VDKDKHFLWNSLFRPKNMFRPCGPMTAGGQCSNFLLKLVYYRTIRLASDKRVAVTASWSVPRLGTEEWPPDMKGTCEYI